MADFRSAPFASGSRKLKLTPSAEAPRIRTRRSSKASSLSHPCSFFAVAFQVAPVAPPETSSPETSSCPGK